MIATGACSAMRNSGRSQILPRCQTTLSLGSLPSR